MTKQILIVGAGPGGCMTANHLAKNLKPEIKAGEVKVTVLSSGDQHIYEAGYLFMALDLKREEHFTKPQKELVMPEVNLVIDAAAKIDVQNNWVTGRSGKQYPYDYLLIATGSQIRPDLTPGLKEGGCDFYTSEGTNKLREQIINFQGGKILCVVQAPHKCPVAFLEILFMLNDYYKIRGIRDKVEFAYTYPEDAIFMSPPVAQFAKPVLDKHGIAYHTAFQTERVDPQSKKVYAKDGRELDYDMLITIPTHRAPQVIFDSGLGDEQGWLDTDPHTLKMKGVNNVYVIGDATNLHKLKVSKAGSAAHYQSEIIAHNIEQELRGNQPNSYYDGKVFCFIETGLNEATCIQMTYGNPPKPAPPSTLLHWFKLSFNEMYWAAVRGLF